MLSTTTPTTNENGLPRSSPQSLPATDLQQQQLTTDAIVVTKECCHDVDVTKETSHDTSSSPSLLEDDIAMCESYIQDTELPWTCTVFDGYGLGDRDVVQSRQSSSSIRTYAGHQRLLDHHLLLIMPYRMNSGRHL